MAKKSAETKKKSAQSFKGAPSGRRLYVLDTNVLLHDPASLYKFEEHHVVIPLTVLEELDKHKKGTGDLARNARQVTRMLDHLLEGATQQAEGFPLQDDTHAATGWLFLVGAQDFESSKDPLLFSSKPDNQILGVAQQLFAQGFEAILVTKDINLRVKARALRVPAEDYRNDHAFSDQDILPKGWVLANDEFWAAAGECHYSGQKGKQQLQIDALTLSLNTFVLMPDGAIWRVIDSTPKTVLEVVPQKPPHGARVTPRNPEQSMALNLLRDPEIDFVSLLGPAGTGKTLLAIAAGLEQDYEIIMTRATVPLGDEIGFLPGSEGDKMSAWLGGTLGDTLESLQIKPDSPDVGRIKLNSMSFMRGRSFQRKLILIDEAQNLTPKQMKALVTRAGDGTKIVVAGNLAQIDTPYLDESSSGLAWAAKNITNWRHAGHLILTDVVRSRLAAFVENIKA